MLDSESGLNGVRNVGAKGNQIAALSTRPPSGNVELNASWLIIAPGFTTGILMAKRLRITAAKRWLASPHAVHPRSRNSMRLGEAKLSFISSADERGLTLDGCGSINEK